MNSSEIQQLQDYLREKFSSPGINIQERSNKDDSVEVYLGEEFLGVIFRDDEDEELVYQFNMAILEIDLPA